MIQGWFHIASTILVVSGGAKLADTSQTAGALEASGLPGWRWLVRALATVEIGTGVAALAGVPGAAWSQAALYLGFAAFVLNAKSRRLPLQSCGCFGKADTPATWGHVIVNVSVAAASVAVAIQPTSLLETLSSQPGFGLPYLGFLGIASYLLILVLSQMPATLRIARS